MSQELVFYKEKQGFGQKQVLTDPFGTAASQGNGVKAIPFSYTSTLNNICLVVTTEGSFHEIMQKVITLCTCRYNDLYFRL